MAALIDTWVLATALGSAMCFAASSALKHVSAGEVSPMPVVHAAAMGRFVQATIRHPLWLAGAGADIVGVALQVVALHLGALAVVQPLLLTSLVFALLFRGLVANRLVPRAELAWGAIVTGLLAGFIWLSQSGGIGATSSSADRWPAAFLAVLGVVGVALVVASAFRTPRMSLRAGLFGLAAGATYAASAALLKSLSDIAVHDVWRLATSGQTYALIVVGGAGLVLGQMSFQAGPLAVGLPVAATVDPLLSILAGVAIFDERLRLGPGHGAVLVVLVALLCLAVLRLATLEAREL